MPIRLQSITDWRRDAALPDDRIRHRLASSLVPQNRRLPLVGDANRGVARRMSRGERVDALLLLEHEHRGHGNSGCDRHFLDDVHEFPFVGIRRAGVHLKAAQLHRQPAAAAGKFVDLQQAARRDDRHGATRHAEKKLRVPEPAGVGGLEEQVLDVLERRADHPERAILGVVGELVVGFDGGDRHPVEREQQHEHEQRQRQVDHQYPPRQRVELLHPDDVVGRRARRPRGCERVDDDLALGLGLLHQSAAPCCHLRRCRPNQEIRMATSRNGIIAVAMAEPSPR